MAYDNDGGFLRVRALPSQPAQKNYIKVKQVTDLTKKNYTNVKDSGAISPKNYVNVLVINYDTPKDYKLVNFIGGSLLGIYVNADLSGGAASGPSYGGALNPPDNHVIGFGTADLFPTSQPDGSSFWTFNPLEVSGRAYLSYDLKANNPDLEVGKTYRFELLMRNNSANEYDAFVLLSNATGITVDPNLNSTLQGGETGLVFFEFFVTTTAFTGNLRYGSGTTANATVHCETLSRPLLYKKPTSTTAWIDGDSWIDGSPWND